MYLTKFDINAARRGARYLLGNPQAFHAAVLSSFPPRPTGAGEGRVLWRVDRNGPHTALYVVSPDEPDLSALNEQAGWSTATWATRDYRPFLDRISEGQTWSFRLTANPVKQSLAPETKGMRLAHVTSAQQAAWLADRAGRNGFRISETSDGTPAVMVSSRSKDSFSRSDPHRGGRSSRVTLVRVQFDGVLTVNDREKFRDALVSGFGRGKAYGCGLMTLMRAE
ncbi:type I-E CRISPR-associated protein Cas6/Cse3/CasE [Arthrobacter sp. YJM1]|nr:type I-E CRISPR-associated protein Cas6/Cse3/CasE [Arthrobacter sp. YJM1]MDP5227054.1 type I-E CRISPR-associated protein Cas6/Cse3/CasE [Arthrobacter sp. YJM1]